LAEPEASVIAAAGGVVLSDENRAALRSADAHVVWLLADVEVLVDRVRNGMHRPLLDDDPEAVLRALYEVRAPLYQEVADAVVSVDHRSPQDVAKAVLRCCA
jgi:shikimate kinase